MPIKMHSHVSQREANMSVKVYNTFIQRLLWKQLHPVQFGIFIFGVSEILELKLHVYNFMSFLTEL